MEDNKDNKENIDSEVKQMEDLLLKETEDVKTNGTGDEEVAKREKKCK
jgi:hypothetical protein